MGANQSQPELPNEKLIIERLRDLQLKDQAEDYVHIDEKAVAGSPTSKSHFRAPWKNLSVSDVQHWEHELLQDSKNRYLHSS